MSAAAAVHFSHAAEPAARPRDATTVVADSVGVGRMETVPSSLQAPALPPVITAVQGLGDSVPAATGCSCTSFVTLLADRLTSVTSHSVAALNEGQNGFTSDDLINQAWEQGTRATPDRVTVITVGANDFDSSLLSSPGCTAADDMRCYQETFVALASHLRELLRLLAPLGQPHGPILVTDYWNVFLDGNVGDEQGTQYVSDSKDLTRRVNEIIADVTRERGLTFVDLDRPFNAHSQATTTLLLAPDGDHPSAEGHQLIATLLQKSLNRL